MSLRITIWNEFRHERQNERVKEVYPDGIHTAIADGLVEQSADDIRIACATLDEPEHGLTTETLEDTDVLFWWGHMAHDQVADAVVQRVHARVLAGMGLVVLHSGHASKIFRRLMGTECMLRWRDVGERERLWIVDPSHPITAGIDGEHVELEQAEMYGEFFDIPQPDELILISWFQGGEVFRSGCTWRRGRGRVFYFRPGHETFPIYYQPWVRRLLANAVHWCAAQGVPYLGQAREINEPLEPLS